MLKYSILKDIHKFVVALSWDFKESGVTDLDIFVLLLNADNHLPSFQHLIFYDNLSSLDGAIQHTGDNLTGKGEGWDEVITGYLELIEPDIQSVLVGISVHDEKGLGTFELFEEAQINLNLGNHVEPIQLFLNDTYHRYKNLVLGHFIKFDDADKGWLFRFDLEGSEERFETFVKSFFGEETDFETCKMCKS